MSLNIKICIICSYKYTVFTSPESNLTPCHQDYTKYVHGHLKYTFVLLVQIHHVGNQKI